MTHAAFITSLTRSVRTRGAAAALDELRTNKSDLAGQPYHETLAVYYVWAVERLVDGGLSDLAVLWHPLVGESSALAWYPVEVLATDTARNEFVPSPMALAHEPQPHLPQHTVAA